MIEHFDFEALRRFLELAITKLLPGGIFVAETVNPHSVQALKSFWVDPTHRAPIFPEVSAALCLLEGFESGRVIFPNGSGELDRDLREEGEYAIVARKRARGSRKSYARSSRNAALNRARPEAVHRKSG